MFENLEEVVMHYEEVINELSEPDVLNNQTKYRKLMKEQTDLTPIVEKYKEYKEVKAGIYSYIDDANDIICYSEIRQVDKTKVTNESKDIFFIVQGNKETSDKYVKDIAKELITVVTYYLGGTGEIL